MLKNVTAAEGLRDGSGKPAAEQGLAADSTEQVLKLNIKPIAHSWNMEGFPHWR
jgi:hypothetical protein